MCPGSAGSEEAGPLQVVHVERSPDVFNAISDFDIL
jgi:hypothetical protein